MLITQHISAQVTTYTEHVCRDVGLPVVAVRLAAGPGHCLTGQPSVHHEPSTRGGILTSPLSPETRSHLCLLALSRSRCQLCTARYTCTPGMQIFSQVSRTVWQETGTRVTCVLRITITGWRHLAAAPDFRDVMRVMMRLSRPWSLSLVFPRGLWFTTDHMTGNSWLRIPPGPDGAVEQARSSGSWLGPGPGSIMHTLCYAHMPPAPRSDWRTQCETGLWLVQPGWSCTDEPISPQILEAYDLIEAARGGGWPCVQCRPGSDHCSPPWPPAMGNLATSGIRQYWDRDQYWLDTPHCQSLSLSLMAPRPARANVSMNWSARHNK